MGSNNPFINMGKKMQKANSDIISPVTFSEKAKAKGVNPFYSLDDKVNDDKKFAILRTTENGKYVVGGMLFFRYKGIEIYTGINNVIFVDTINDTLFIGENEKVQEEINPTDPENKQYILLMKTMDGDNDYYIWEAMTGRLATYKYIIDNIEALGIDPENSLVLVDTVPYKDALTISNFVKYLQNAEIVPEDGFDIDYYTY